MVVMEEEAMEVEDMEEEAMVVMEEEAMEVEDMEEEAMEVEDMEGEAMVVMEEESMVVEHTIPREAKEADIIPPMVVMEDTTHTLPREAKEAPMLLMEVVVSSQFIRCNCGYWSIHFSHSKKECQ